MKKLILTFLAVMLCLNTYAGDSRLSIWGSYSLGKGVSEVGSNTVTEAYFSGPGYTSILNDNSHGKSAATLGVDYCLTGGLFLGLSWTTGGKFTEWSNDNPEKLTEIKAAYKTNYLLFNCKYEWLKYGGIRLYSRAGIGVGFTSGAKLSLGDFMNATSDNVKILATRGPSEDVAWQVSVVGFEYKPSRLVGVFVEGGFGNQGNLLAGIRIYAL